MNQNRNNSGRKIKDKR